ncbi:hypothetical protein LTR36_006604 [Oleoguttula mirabilis]|uniref:Cyclin-L2 n=1 Tax=Oleoguttula mirabilis TaxID=1507867 RepID=A0AAV9JBU7_9PEZI|nr:hypothetical protein LTR36_006604 [Oleoguttula mirabilis]
MAPITAPSHLANPLATSLQLETSSSQLDGVPSDLEDSVRYETARLIQTAGILLRLPQEIIAQSIIVLQRFWVGPDGGSMLECDPKDAAAAALYLSAKPSAHPVSPRQLLTVFDYLAAIRGDFAAAAAGAGELKPDRHLSEGDYEAQRDRLYKTESCMLRVLGFQTHVALPYTLCINYLQALEVFQTTEGSLVAKRAFAHLTSALLSPQSLYLTHQPSALATASIYLAAREVDVKLPEVEWWEVFDVDREELGFLVVALTSLAGFAVEENRKWGRRMVPLTTEELRAEIERQRMLEAGA